MTAAHNTYMMAPRHQGTFAWRDFNQIRIGCRSGIANRACASRKDGQVHRYHKQTMANICKFVFVYGQCCGHTAPLFSETNLLEHIKSYRWLSLCLFYRKMNVLTQPHRAKISLNRTQARQMCGVVCLLWRVFCCVEFYDLTDGELEIFRYSGSFIQWEFVEVGFDY